MTLDLLRDFLQVGHELASATDRERAEHAETRKLAEHLGRDLRRTKALLVESETVRRGQADELRQLRQGVVPLRQGSRDHLGPPVRCWCDAAHGHEQATALNAGRDRIEANT